MKCATVLHLILVIISTSSTTGKRVHPFDPELSHDSTYLTYHFGSSSLSHHMEEHDTSSSAVSDSSYSPEITKIHTIYAMAIAPAAECAHGQLKDPNGICRRKWGWTI